MNERYFTLPIISNNNGNMEALKRRFYCKSSFCPEILFYVIFAMAGIRSLKYLLFLIKYSLLDDPSYDILSFLTKQTSTVFEKASKKFLEEFSAVVVVVVVVVVAFFFHAKLLID